MFWSTLGGTNTVLFPIIPIICVYDVRIRIEMAVLYLIAQEGLKKKGKIVHEIFILST